MNAADRSHIFLGSTRIATLTDGEVRYYHMDHLGGTNVTTDADADVMQVIEYHPYGKDEIVVDNELSDSQRAWNQFTSHYKDSESGLIYMQARYYDVDAARFLSPDTIVQNPDGDPQTFNRYSYVGNNPVNRVDPSGHFWKKIKRFFGKIVGAIAGAIAFVATLGNPGAAYAAFTAFNLTDTIVSGVIALADGASPGKILGAIGLSILLNKYVPGAGKLTGALKHGFNAVRGAAISVATTAAVWGRRNLGSAAAWGAGMAALGSFLRPANAGTEGSGDEKQAEQQEGNQQSQTTAEEDAMIANESKDDPIGVADSAEDVVNKSNQSFTFERVIGRVKFGNEGGGRDFGLMAFGAGEVIVGFALQVASAGLFAPSGGVSTAGISAGFGLMATGFVDIHQGFVGGKSVGAMVHESVYGIKNEAGILYPYIKIQTGDFP